MSLPSLVFGAVIASLYGAVFHLWRGGGVGRLLLFLLLAWLGFWLGHALAAYAGIDADRIGELHLGSATLGSAVFLALGYFLTKLNPK